MNIKPKMKTQEEAEAFLREKVAEAGLEMVMEEGKHNPYRELFFLLDRKANIRSPVFVAFRITEQKYMDYILAEISDYIKENNNETN